MKWFLYLYRGLFWIIKILIKNLIRELRFNPDVKVVTKQPKSYQDNEQPPSCCEKFNKFNKFDNFSQLCPLTYFVFNIYQSFLLEESDPNLEFKCSKIVTPCCLVDITLCFICCPLHMATNSS